MSADPELGVGLGGVDVGAGIESEEAGDLGMVAENAPVVVLDGAAEPDGPPLLLHGGVLPGLHELAHFDWRRKKKGGECVYIMMALKCRRRERDWREGKEDSVGGEMWTVRRTRADGQNCQRRSDGVSGCLLGR